MTRRPIRYRKVCSNDIHSPCSGDCVIIAGSLEIANQMAAPNNPGLRHRCDGPGFEIEPQRAPGPMWPIQSADRSMATVGWRRQEFPRGPGSKQIQNVL